MAGWVRDGSHKLSRWEAILPSMTSGSQAGILHGNNDGIPAFRWYERDRQHLMVSSSPVDADADRVAAISNGEGLLSNNGASICNLMTGDATRAYLTTAAIKAEGGGHRRQPRVHVVLLQPDRLPALVHAVPRRVRQGDDPGPAHPALRHQAADASRAEVRRACARPATCCCATSTRADHRRDVPRHQRHLRRLHRLRRARPPLRSRAGRVARRRSTASTRRSRPWSRRPRRRRGRTSSSSCPTTARASARRSCSATASASASTSASLMSGRATLVQTKTKAEGSTFVNSFLSEITQAKGVGPTVARAALASKTTDGVVDLDDDEEEPPIADAVDDRRRRLRQPRSGLVHRPRPPADGRGARGAPSGAGRGGRRPSRASGCCWSARRSSARSCSGRRARASSTRTGSKARTRRRCSARTRS